MTMPTHSALAEFVSIMKATGTRVGPWRDLASYDEDPGSGGFLVPQRMLRNLMHKNPYGVSLYEEVRRSGHRRFLRWNVRHMNVKRIYRRRWGR